MSAPPGPPAGGDGAAGAAGSGADVPGAPDPDDVVPIDAEATRRRRLLGIALFIVLPIAFATITFGLSCAMSPRGARIWTETAN